MKKNINNKLRNINKNFQQEKELEESLKYEIAKEIIKKERSNKKDKKWLTKSFFPCNIF